MRHPDLIILRFFTLLLALGGCIANVHAQVDPVYKAPAPISSPTQRAISMTRDLYERLILVENPDSIASSLSELMRRDGKPCPTVTDFQVIFRQGAEQRLKIKCPGISHYGMTIRQGGSVQIFGGDGMVGEFNAGEGLIHAVKNADRPALDLKPKRPNLGPNGNLPGLLQGDDPNHIPAWLVTLIIVNGFIVGALILSFFWFMRAKTTPQRAEIPKDLELSSIEKDSMVIESREILPDIYQHPDGVFISRGKRGKRRLFRHLFFAIMYRDYGWKLREVSWVHQE